MARALCATPATRGLAIAWAYQELRAVWSKGESATLTGRASRVSTKFTDMVLPLKFPSLFTLTCAESPSKWAPDFLGAETTATSILSKCPAPHKREHREREKVVYGPVFILDFLSSPASMLSEKFCEKCCFARWNFVKNVALLDEKWWKSTNPS